MAALVRIRSCLRRRMARRGTCRVSRGFYGDIVSDYTPGEDRIVFEGMQGISYTGRVFEIVDGSPFGSTEDAIDADPTIQNEIVFILETGSEFSDTGIQGHLYVKGVGTGVDFDQMHIILKDVSVPPPAKTFCLAPVPSVLLARMAMIFWLVVVMTTR